MFVCSLGKAGVPQPKLAYRLDCHNIMHKKPSGIIFESTGNTAVFGDMLLGIQPGENPMGNPGYHLPNGFSACFKSHASTLAVFTPEGMFESISMVAAYQRENPS